MQGINTAGESSRNKRDSDGEHKLKRVKPEDTHKAKRVRVSRACDQCRAAREKCDGAQPRCNTCQSQRRICSYNEQPKKRGIQPNYIRTLELALAWLLKTFPDSEARLSTALPNAQATAHRLIAAKDAAAAETLHSAWRNTIICRQIDQILSGSEIEAPKATSLSLEGGETHYQSPPMSLLSDLHPAPFGAAETAMSTRDDDVIVLAAAPDSSARSRTVKLPHDSWALLEHFFAFTHAWLPIAERHDLLKLMYSYPSDGLNVAEAKSAKHAELWSIMTLASLQTTSGGDVERFRSLTKDLLPTEHESFEIGHVKALLVLCLVEMSRGTWLAAWLLVGSAIRILTYLGVEASSDTTASKYHHTLLAAFLLESAVASRTGARPHLQSGQIHDIGLLIEDGLEEWSPWHDPNPEATPPTIARSPARSISTFNALVRIALSYYEARNLESADPGEDFICLWSVLRNAAADHGRRQPSILVTEMQHASDEAGLTGVGGDEMETKLRSSKASDPEDASGAGAALDQQYPFVSIPTVASVTGSTSTFPNMWDNRGANFGLSPQAPTPDLSNDIFEELALLDRTDSSTHPHFMQNLGFGPDVDLAEFFGSDYQPSDPMLAYMHTTKPEG